MSDTPKVLASLASGVVFGIGLAISGMLDPQRVRGFLDIFGTWDPSLAFVLGGAVFIAAIGTLVRRRLARPLLGGAFHLPDTSRIDARLIFGSAIFGIGWGMVGLCPGPAIAALSMGLQPVFIFVVAMTVGILIRDRLWRPA